jgi:ribosomal RNA-processing protein 1
MALETDHVCESVLHNFAKRLANNEPRLRKIALRKLQKWIEARSDGFGENEFLKVWKGLHYCMWMTDKPLIQEELAERITQMVHCFKNFDTLLCFVRTFFMTEAREWSGTDQLRMDKFMTLIRKMLRQSLHAVQNRGWADSDIAHLMDVLYSTMLDCTNERVPDGLRFHVNDIYLDELSHVGKGQLNAQQVLRLTEPFCQLVTKSSNKLLVNHTIKAVFIPLLKQGGSGSHAVESDHLQIDRQQLADRLMKLASKRSCQNRSIVYRLVKRCHEVVKAPSQVSQAAVDEDSEADMNVDEADAVAANHTVDEDVSVPTKNSTGMEMTNKKKKQKKKKERNVVSTAAITVNGSMVAEACASTTTVASPTANVNEALELERLAVMTADADGSSSRKRKLEEDGEDEDGDAEESSGDGVECGVSGEELEEEVEIWIPNKKYKKAKTALDDNGGIRKKMSQSSSKGDQPFLTFVSIDKTPAALVRHRQKRMPSSEPKQQKTPASSSNCIERSSTDQQKRVKFAMNLNKSQNFEESLSVTPKPPFDPRLQPDRTILKPSPVGVTTAKVSINRTPKQKPFGSRARARASDFF